MDAPRNARRLPARQPGFNAMSRAMASTLSDGLSEIAKAT
jgi:hypothetical protein